MTAFSRSNQLDVQHPVPAPSAQTEMHRRNPLQVIWLRRWIVVVVTILAMAVGVIQFYRATPMYQSKARVYVTQAAPKFSMGDAASVMTATNNYLFTQCELICSPRILQMVAARPDISNLPTFRNSENGAAGSAANIVGFLRGSVSAIPGRRDDIISIFVKTPNGKDSADIANAMIEEYTRFHLTTNKNTAIETFKLLQKAKADTDLELQKMYKARQEFQKAHSQYSLGQDKGNATVDRLNQLSSALTGVQLDLMRANSQYDSTKAMMTDPEKIRQLMNAPGFRAGDNAQMRGKLRDLQEQFVQLSTVLGPISTSLTAAQNQLKRLQTELDEADRRDGEAYLTDLATKRDAAKQQETQISQYLRDQREEVLKLNSAEAEFDEIEAEVRRLERDSQGRSDQMKDINIALDVDRPMNITVVENAVPAGYPIEPDKASIMFYSLMIGAIGGVGLAFAREYADQRLRSADEIKTALDLAILGVVPHIQNARTPSQRGMQLHLNPMSDVAESYRTVRTAIYFGNPHGVAKTLLVTSPSPGDGKTTLASNLAIAMAQAGNRILLLDADFRKPMQHKIFELKKKVGLSSVLAGDTPLEDAIQDTPISGLHVLPCGPIPANPSEILNSQTFADLLDELSNRYDHVLLDSPPVMPVSDSRILAASCDATILALRAEKTTRKGAIYARDMLRSVGSRILGVVVNDVPRRKGVYGYYYTDADVYTYGYANNGKNGSNGVKKSLPKPEEQTVNS